MGWMIFLHFSIRLANVFKNNSIQVRHFITITINIVKELNNFLPLLYELNSRNSLIL